MINMFEVQKHPYRSRTFLGVVFLEAGNNDVKYKKDKINKSYYITYLIQMLAFEWWVIRCESKDGHQKLCLKEI